MWPRAWGLVVTASLATLLQESPGKQREEGKNSSSIDNRMGVHDLKHVEAAGHEPVSSEKGTASLPPDTAAKQVARTTGRPPNTSLQPQQQSCGQGQMKATSPTRGLDHGQ